MSRFSVTRTVGILPLFLVACTAPPPDQSYVVQQPKTAPVRNMTSFTPALQCMDDLFSRQDKKNYMITSAGIPDATGQLQAGTKEMLISTIARMSAKSNAFTFVDFDIDKKDVLAAQQLIGIPAGFEVPRYYIRGAITQVDKGVMNDRVGVGISVTQGGLGYSSETGTSVITVDLNMGDLVSRKIIPNVSTSNSIVVTRKGTGADADAQIQKFGVSFEFAMDRSEGSHQALRTLIELSLIETLGKFAGVPYWNCLQIKQTDPNTLVQARDQYDQDGNLLQTIIPALVAGGYLERGSNINNPNDPRLRQAIAKYQADNDLVATGRPSFELYYKMVGKEPSQPAAATVAGGITPSPQTSTSRGKINVYLNTPRGTTPSYTVGERLDMTAQVSDDAYLYCYYSDEAGKIARVYPNRYTPNAYLNAGQSISIPSPNAGFSIEFSEVGQRQEVLCLASKQELGVKLPVSFKAADLEPIGAASLEDVVQTFQRLDQDSLAYQRMKLTVIRK